MNKLLNQKPVQENKTNNQIEKKLIKENKTSNVVSFCPQLTYHPLVQFQTSRAISDKIGNIDLPMFEGL